MSTGRRSIKPRGESLARETIGVLCRDAAGKPACNGSGQVYTDRGFDICSCLQQYRLLSQYLRAGVPEKFWMLELDNLKREFVQDNPEALDITRTYMEALPKMVQEGVGLYISGSNGVTTLGCIILKAAVRAGIPIAYTTMQGLVEDLKREIDADDPEFEEWMHHLRFDTKLLMIDDIGASFQGDPAGWTSAQLVDLFSHLFADKRSLVVTSNIPLKGMSLTLTEAISSKLLDLVEVDVVGKSLTIMPTKEEKKNKLMVLSGKPAARPVRRVRK